MSMAQALKEPLAELAPAFPCPAGGMSFEGLPTLANDYGVDSVFLVGGSLHGHADSIVKGTEEFQRRIASLFPEHRHQAAQPQLEPRRKPVVVKSDEGVQTLLKHFGEYHWQHRTDRVYKGGGELPFAGVRRVELVGKNGEIADFDLRFFELEPGGYTSLEKHLHTHVIIFTHGEGEVRVGGAVYQVGANDIAYVPPLQVHQIRNLGASSMGFYCIVDHERDRPMRP
jgi:ribulose-bisphosphate carboxylase large chain